MKTVRFHRRPDGTLFQEFFMADDEFVLLEFHPDRHEFSVSATGQNGDTTKISMSRNKYDTLVMNILEGAKEFWGLTYNSEGP